MTLLLVMVSFGVLAFFLDRPHPQPGDVFYMGPGAGLIGNLLNGIAAVGLLWIMFFVFAPSLGYSHEAPTGWKYPWSCCSNLDCKMVDAKAVLERPEGYVIRSTGEVVAYADKRVKDSPDGEYHWCAHQAGLDAGRTICLFVPPKGF